MGLGQVGNRQEGNRIGADAVLKFSVRDAMAIFRQYIAPFLILLVFLVALAAVSFRSFLPDGMSGPAPVDVSLAEVSKTLGRLRTT